MKKYLINRWRERSTRLSLVGLAVAVIGHYLTPEWVAVVSPVVLALVGVTPDKVQ